MLDKCTNYLLYGISKKSSMESKKVQIFEHIQTFPGKTFSEITNELQLSPSTVRFHLTTLKRDNFIIDPKIDKTRYFITNKNNQRNQIKISIENNPRLREIIQILDRPKKLDEILNEIKISKSILSKRLKILINFDVVEKMKVDSKMVFMKKDF